MRTLEVLESTVAFCCQIKICYLEGPKKYASDFLRKHEVYFYRKKDTGTSDFLAQSVKSFFSKRTVLQIFLKNLRNLFFEKIYASDFLGKSEVYFFTFQMKDISLAVKSTAGILHDSRFVLRNIANPIQPTPSIESTALLPSHKGIKLHLIP